MRRLLISAVLFAICAVRVSFLIAEEVHYDVFVSSTGTGTKLVVGRYDEAANTAQVPTEQALVFGGHVVGAGTAQPYESEAPGEPGFRAGTQAFLNGSSVTPSGVYKALTGSTALTFTFQPITIGTSTRNLFFWNGDGTVDFGEVGSDVVLGLTKPGGGGWTASITGASSGIVAGNTIQNTSATGLVHTHLFTSIGKDAAAPDQGFYLFALRLAMAGYTSSDPIYFVSGALDPSDLAPQFADLEEFEVAHGLAKGWVEANMMAVPEPTGGLLATAGCAAIAAGGLLRRRGAAAAGVTRRGGRW